MSTWRVIFILYIGVRYGLDEFILSHDRLSPLRHLSRIFLFWRRFTTPRSVRLRQALERLGPIFVKFGQALSTRRDLIPPDIAEELARLQDRVPPFPGSVSVSILEATYRRPLHEVFAHFDPEPVASASVAQVHFATLHNGQEAAVKILRPQIGRIIARDIGLMLTLAHLLQRWIQEARRLRPVEVVGEFRKHLADELDLMVEASNASQLRRNFADRRLLIIPEIYWDYCDTQVMVMERMKGIPISQVDQLRNLHIDIPKLARDGVEIFFTQVFRDGFFHADMHPGNIQVAEDGRYIGLDFGIIGTLTLKTKIIWHRIFWLSSSAIINVLRQRISKQGGCLQIPAPTNSNPRSVRSANRFSTNHSRKFHSEKSCCDYFRFHAVFRWKFNRNWYFCKKPCSMLKVWVEISTPTWICGKPPSRSWNAG